MARSVILAGTIRCDGCCLPPRWCLCEALQPVESPVAVDVLIHRRENWRPTSTGKLVARTLVGARTHVYQRVDPPTRESIARPGRELWILHPQGEPVERLVPRPADEPAPQVLLLDGNWAQAGEMLRTVHGWGRPVRLSQTGASRFWLRSQEHLDRFSTAEALIAVLQALGDTGAADRLRLQFELHVYATLRARGHKEAAGEYLAGSALPGAFPEFLARLHERRPNPSEPGQARLGPHPRPGWPG
ncbi:MAG: tRNA-uridine aminocarboxypropyltransferase [Verrucomicrobiota bacterium]